MQVTKKQHYISQGIIKLFTNSDKRVYELIVDGKKILNSEIINCMCQNYIYEHPELKTNTIENLFGKIESRFIPNVKDLIIQIDKFYGTNSKDINAIKRKIHKMLIWFLFFYFRSGALLTEYSSFSDNPRIERVERMLYNILDFSYLSKLALTIKKCYKFTILVSDDEHFIMSDQYISTAALAYKNNFLNGSNRQIGLKDTLILIPLTSKYYIAFYNGNAPYYFIENRFCSLTADQVREINTVIYKNAYLKCLAKISMPLETVVQSQSIRKGARKSLALFDDNDVHSYVTKKEVYFYSIDEDLDENFIQYASDYITKIKGKIGRNSICICGSGKKYKNCCMQKYEKANKAWLDIKYKHTNYSILGALVIERAIVDYYGPEAKMPEKDLKKLDEIKNLIKQSKESASLML
jgi:uncharacterized protein YchJ